MYFFKFLFLLQLKFVKIILQAVLTKNYASTFHKNVYCINNYKFYFVKLLSVNVHVLDSMLAKEI